MDKKYLALALIPIIVLIFFPLGDADIPPTPAFWQIQNDGDMINATSYKSVFTLSEGDNVVISLNSGNNTVRISALTPELSLEDLSNVTSGCSTGQVRTVNSTGWWVCSNLSAAGIQSINGDSTSAQTIVGSPDRIVVNTVTGVTTVDIGTDILTIDSIISDLADVASGCNNNQILKFQSSNSTWICADDNAGVTGITSINGDTTAAQNILGTSGNVTINNSGATHIINLGPNVVVLTGAQTLTSKSIDADTNTITNIDNNDIKIAAGIAKSKISSSDTFPWAEISKLGSKIGDIADVADGCQNGQFYQYQVSNSTWICRTLSNSTSTGITKINGQTGSTQTIQGVSGNVTISNTVNGTTKVNTGDQVVVVGGSPQTITKGVTLNSATLGGSLNANSQRITSLGTPTAGTDAEPANRMGLIGNKVTSSCSNGQVLQYQTSNSTWICRTLSNSTSTGITKINGQTGPVLSLTGTTNHITVSNPINGTINFDIPFKINTKSASTRQHLTSFSNSTGNFGTMIFGVDDPAKICSSTDKISAISLDNSTGDWTITCSSDQTGSGITKVNNVGSGTIKLIQTNSSNTVNVKSITTTRGLTLTNGTTAADISTNFKVNSKTCSAGQYVSAVNNSTSTDTFTCSTVSGLPVSLSGNLTTTSTAAFTTIFTIPLTGNSGNTVQGTLVAETNTAGAAVQTGARLSAATQNGWCLWETPTTATASTLDYLVLSTTTAETGETVWLPAANVPGVIKFTCVTKGSGTPNLLVEFQAEVASTVTIRGGSMYIKTP